MIQALPQPKPLKILWATLLGSFLVSCGSYQQASYYDNDGIYTKGEKRTVVERPTQQVETVEKESDGIYGDYFGQRADQIDDIMENEIFTDVDEYYGGVENDSILGEQEYADMGNDYAGFGGWGDNASRVEINVYPDYGWGGFGGWNSPFFGGLGWGGLYGGLGGWYNPWWGPRFYSPWWYGGGFGWGYAGWGYGGWGYGGWGYGGFGYGGYGYGYHPYYGYNNRYSYNRSRRGYYNSGLASNSLRGRSNTGLSRGNSNVRYRSNSGRSNASRSSTASRTSTRNRSNVAGRSAGIDGIARNRAYRSSRSTRALPNYNRSSRSNLYNRSSRSN